MMSAARMLSLLCVLLLVLPVGMSQTPPPASGDWIISDSTTISNETIDLAGNLIVKAGGRLVLDNVVLRINCALDGQYAIRVESGADLVLNGTTVTCPTDGLYYKFQIYGDADIKNSTIEKVWGMQSSIPYWVGGIEIYSDNVKIVGSTVRYCYGNGLTINSSSPEIRNCTITDNGWRAISCCGDASAYIAGNNLSNSRRGVVVLDNSSSVIEYNTMTQNAIAGVMCWNVSSPIIRYNTIIGSGSTGMQNSHFSKPWIFNNTIEYYIEGIHNRISSNSTIINNTMRYNSYSGIANYNDSIARIEGNWIFDNNCNGIQNIGNTNITITNNTIWNSYHSGIYNGDSVVAWIENNTIYQNNQGGVYNTYYTQATLIDNIVHNNSMSGIFNELYSTVTIRNNTIYWNTDNGITNLGLSNVTMEHNTITDNYGSGIYSYMLSESPVLIIVNNTISDSYWDGILNRNYANSMIKDNRIADSGVMGIQCSEDSISSIDDNTVSESGIFGVSVDDNATARMNNNTITDSNSSGVHCASRSHAEMTNNTVSGKRAQGVSASGTCYLTLRKNRIHSNWMAVSTVDSAAVVAENNTFEDNDYGITLGSKKANFTANTISGGAYGFRLTECSPTLDGNRIFGSDCGMQFLNSSALVNGSTMSGIRECVMDCGAASSPWIVNSTLTPAAGGVVLRATDGSAPTVLNTVFDSSLVRLFDTSSLRIKWYLQLDVKDSKTFPVDRANVSVEGVEDVRGMTDADGKIGWLPLEDRTLRAGSETKAVHRIVIEKEGDSNLYSGILINRSESREFKFDFSPVVSFIPSLFLNEDQPFVLDLSQYIQDRDHDTDELDVSLAGDTASEAGVSLYGKNLTLNYSLPVPPRFVSFNVTDGARNASGRFMVHLNKTNDAPVFTSPGTVVLNEDEMVTVDLRPYLSDEESGVEELRIELNSSYAALHGLEILFCYPDGVQNDRILVRVLDPEGASCERALEIDVIPVNDPPRLKSIPEMMPYEDIELVVDLSGMIEDPDNAITCITTRTDSRYCLVDGLKLVFLYPEGVLVDAFNLTLSDGSDNTTYNILIRIRPVNDPTNLTIPTIGVVAGESRTVDISGLITDPDTPISDIRIWSNSPHVKINGFNVTISYPKDTPSGSKRIDLKLSDDMGTYSYEIPVNVTASPPIPVPASNLYLYILLPLAIIGTAAGILIHRRVRYGWYRMRRAMLVNTDGRLLAHVGEMGDAEDEMLVSSMLTAIQQFINEVMKKEKAGAIKEFMYEDLKIAVEGGERIYLAVFIEGYATDGLRTNMKEIVTEMEKKYRVELASWDGRMTQESFITEAKSRLVTLKEGSKSGKKVGNVVASEDREKIGESK